MARTLWLISGAIGIALWAATPYEPAQGEENGKEKPIPAKQQFGFVAGPAQMKPRAVGYYTRGCLAGGARLEVDGPAWQAMRLSRNRNWGHPDMIAYIKNLAVESKKSGWPGLLVGDISQPRGGPMLTGHRSHQVGLDADIWYRPMPSKRFTFKEREIESAIPLADYRGTEVIAANWRDGYVGLLKRAATDKRIQRILVHPAVKKKLCQSAGTDRAWLQKIRPVWGHNYHFHVRMKCPAGVAGCRAQKATAPGDGCGAQLDYWMKLLKTPPRPRTKPKVPPKPRPVRTIDWLPKQCRTVLANGQPTVFTNPRTQLTSVPLPLRRQTKAASSDQASRAEQAQ